MVDGLQPSITQLHGSYGGSNRGRGWKRLGLRQMCGERWGKLGIEGMASWVATIIEARDCCWVGLQQGLASDGCAWPRKDSDSQWGVVAGASACGAAATVGEEEGAIGAAAAKGEHCSRGEKEVEGSSCCRGGVATVQ
ncbi:hypothetical protein B296_00020450 [Ensete ventricosum]|uniref:Uncharacterized protein n=1 Tax=Ensete ventricosum TaxID=4639 RepID=A0A426YQC4_ENSVE|nr:hypothetical protein B296_00020450 [Ensete ventricosum]